MRAQTIIRFKQLTEQVGLSRSTIYRLVSAGDFPKPVVLSPHAVGFLGSDVDAWLAGRAVAGEKQ